MIKKVLCLMILAAMLVLPAAAANVTYPQDYYDLQNEQYQILHPVGIGFLSNTTYDMRWTVTNAGMSGDAGEVIFLELRRQTILMEKQNELLAEQNEILKNQSITEKLVAVTGSSNVSDQNEKADIVALHSPGMYCYNTTTHNRVVCP